MMGNIMAVNLAIRSIFFVVVLLKSIFIPVYAKYDASLVEQEFNRFIQKYNKPYKEGDAEYDTRLKIFEWNLEHHFKLNANRQDNISAVYGVTKFSDLTPPEFEGRYLSSIKLDSDITKPTALHYPRPLLFATGQSVKDTPLRVDWRKKGIITPVKNQHACGGCWAFSAVETVEAMKAIATGDLRALSVQEVIDCSYGFSILSGCEGGDTCAALSWMVKSKTPLVTAQLYPLTDHQQTCQILSNDTRGVRVDNFTCQTLVKDEAYLIKLLVSYGPVAVSVDATNWSNYQGGIIQYHCGDRGNNHAVQIVGYDGTGPVPYYIVKNSWGTDFGLDGYVYVKAGDNMCDEKESWNLSFLFCNTNSVEFASYGIAREVAAVAVKS